MPVQSAQRNSIVVEIEIQWGTDRQPNIAVHRAMPLKMILPRSDSQIFAQIHFSKVQYIHSSNHYTLFSLALHDDHSDIVIVLSHPLG